jgi:hypothetical protein
MEEAMEPKKPISIPKPKTGHFVTRDSIKDRTSTNASKLPEPKKTPAMPILTKPKNKM